MRRKLDPAWGTEQTAAEQTRGFPCQKRQSLVAARASRTQDAARTGDGFSFQFKAPWTCDYCCKAHPYITGKIIVK